MTFENSLQKLNTFNCKPKSDNSQLKVIYDGLLPTLIIQGDSLLGVTTTYNENSATYTRTTGNQDVTPDDNTAPTTAKTARAPFVANQMAQRCLNCARGIDFAFAKLAEQAEGQANFYQQLRKMLAEQVHIFLSDYKEINDRSTLTDIDSLEKSFNNKLMYFLAAGRLDQGITKDNAVGAYEECLCAYRDYAASLSKAASIETITDIGNNVTIREVATPITTKTAAQKAVITQMKTKAGCDFQKKLPPYLRMLQSLFADELCKDDRMLAPQLRKTLPVGLKNAYYCETTVDKPGDQRKELHLVRCGTIAHAGNGVTRNQQTAYAAGNVEQLENFSQTNYGNKAIHFTLLNTVAPYNREARIVRSTYRGMKARNTDNNKSHQLSYVPNNVDGTCRHPVIAQCVHIATGLRGVVHTLRMRVRSLFAAKVARGAADADHLSVVLCASGQDRTGTVATAMEATFIQEQLGGTSLQAVFSHLGRGLHSALLATLASPGCWGMKRQSRARGLFGESEKDFYCATADNNKKARLNEREAKNVKSALPCLRLQQQENGTFALQPHFRNILAPLYDYINRSSGLGGLFPVFNSYYLMNLKCALVKGFLATLTDYTVDNLKESLTKLRDTVNTRVHDYNNKIKWNLFRHNTGRCEAAINVAISRAEATESCYRNPRPV